MTPLISLVLIAHLSATSPPKANLPSSPFPAVASKSIYLGRRRTIAHDYDTFLDRPSRVALIASVSLLGFDAGQTCHNLATGGHEDFLPTQSCAGTTAILAGETTAAWVGAYLAHRRGLHKLERILEWTMPVVNTRAIVYSHNHGAF